jgi:hypothetical protein
MTDKQKEKLRSLFLRLTKSKGFLSIEEVVARLDAGDFWTDEFLESAVFEAKKSLARKFAREAKDKNGERVFQSIEFTDSDGETKRAYMQEALFDLSQYKQATAYHSRTAAYHLAEAKRLQHNCLERYKVQIELPFDGHLKAHKATKPQRQTKGGKHRKPTAEV